MLFSYTTSKVVRIRDSRLAIAYILSVLGVFLYALVYVLLDQKRMFRLAPAENNIRLNLQKPVPTPDPEQLLYCLQNGTTPYYGRARQECVLLDEFDVVFPPPAVDSIFVTSRESLSTIYMPTNCTVPDSLACAYTNLALTNATTHFVAGLEEYTLFVDHTLIVPAFGISIPYYQMQGELLGVDGTRYTGGGDGDGYATRQSSSTTTTSTSDTNTNTNGIVFPPSPTPENVDSSRNIFSLGQLLQAAGVPDLDATSSVSAKPMNSMRYDGFVVLVTMTYSNFVAGSLAPSSFNLASYRYTLTARHIPETEFNIYQAQYSDYPSSRLVFNRHGVMILFQAEGMIAQFDFLVVLINLVSSVGLLTAAVMVLDLTAVHIMPYAHKIRIFVERQMSRSGSQSFGSKIDGL